MLYTQLQKLVKKDLTTLAQKIHKSDAEISNELKKTTLKMLDGSKSFEAGADDFLRELRIELNNQ